MDNTEAHAMMDSQDSCRRQSKENNTEEKSKYMSNTDSTMKPLDNSCFR